MGETEKTRGARLYAEAKVQELVAARVTGKPLQEQLADVVRRLAEEGVSQTEARLLLQRVYKRDRREHSAEFHKRVRAATKGTSHYEVKVHEREGRRQRLQERLEKAGLPEQRVAQLLNVPTPGRKPDLH